MARDNSINLIDTAISYGTSQRKLGLVGLDEFQVVTKIQNNVSSKDVRSWLMQQIEVSLRDLKIDSLYGLLLHDPEILFGAHGIELIKALELAKKNGLIKKVGVSIYSPQELPRLLQTLQLDIVQLPLNIVDQRIKKLGWLSKLKGLNIEIHARSIYLQGLLLMPKGSMDLKFIRWIKLWDEWYSWQTNNQISPQKICIDYVSSIKEIDRIIVGVTNSCELSALISNFSISAVTKFPDISCDDELLINPMNWGYL